MSKEVDKWRIETHSSQIADTGDYDGRYELTNGSISLITKDDIPEMADDALVELLNEMGCKWENWELDNTKYELYLIAKDYKTLWQIAETLYKELKWATECCYEESSSADRAVGIVKECENQLNQIP